MNINKQRRRRCIHQSTSAFRRSPKKKTPPKQHFLLQSIAFAFRNVWENFVFGELFKHTTSADVAYRLLNFRDADKFEVDVVIENTGGQLVGVEVKASATVRERDLRGLKKLARLAGDQFTAGVLLYDGDETLPLGSNIWAAPLSTLWGS